MKRIPSLLLFVALLAALAALYNGYAEKDLDKEAAMTSFKEAERFGEMADDSLTMARAQYQMGSLLYYEGSKACSLLYPAILRDTLQARENHAEGCRHNGE
jgi:hypothetical protein